MKSPVRTLILAIGIAALHCGGGGNGSEEDATVDPGTPDDMMVADDLAPPSEDIFMDPGSDPGTDPGSDEATDPLPDPAEDLVPDIEIDTGYDPGTDDSAEFPDEVTTDVPVDLPMDVPPDVPSELPTDLPSDLPNDIPVEVATELPSDIPEEVAADLPPDLPEHPPDIPAEDLPVDVPVDTCETPGCDAGPPGCLADPLLCVDDDPCTDDICHGVTGVCSNPPLVCDDDNPCTEDSCDPVEGCVHVQMFAEICNGQDDDCDGLTDEGFGLFGGDCVCVRFVNGQQNPPTPDGLTWGTAFPTVQAGITSAFGATQAPEGPSVCEVWVALGTYPVYSSDPTDTIQLQPGVQVFGGLLGNEDTRDLRDWATNVTTLDGADQVYHVVLGSDLAVVDGFTITGGKGGSSWDGVGAGMFNDNQSPSVTNCTFTGNNGQNGAGMGNVSSTPTITNCTFQGNIASNSGGGIMNDSSSPVIIDSLFIGNTANKGGAMHSTLESPTVVNTVFWGNTASYGGALLNNASAPTLINCTFSRNEGLVEGGAMINFQKPTTVTNCVLWGDISPDDPEFHNIGGATPLVTYSVVQGGDGAGNPWPGDGNLDEDPDFLDPDTGDLHLGENSECVDAANGDAAPPADRDGLSRFNDPDVPNTGFGDPDYVDMGAYERQ